jgi:hypothetical protein
MDPYQINSIRIKTRILSVSKTEEDIMGMAMMVTPMLETTGAD